MAWLDPNHQGNTLYNSVPYILFASLVSKKVWPERSKWPWKQRLNRYNFALIIINYNHFFNLTLGRVFGRISQRQLENNWFGMWLVLLQDFVYFTIMADGPWSERASSWVRMNVDTRMKRGVMGDVHHPVRRHRRKVNRRNRWVAVMKQNSTSRRTYCECLLKCILSMVK